MKPVKRSWYKEQTSCPSLTWTAVKPPGEKWQNDGKRRRHPLLSKGNYFLFLVPVLLLEPWNFKTPEL